jgi:type IX secretion system PorP/SprF family membrane protein
MNEALCITSAYRTQWVSFPGAPKTFLLTADMPVEDLSGGIGLTIMKDKLGNFNFTHARAAYSLHRNMYRGIGKVGLGVELGMLQSSIDNNWLAPDGSHGEYDDAIPETFIKKSTYDFGLGVYYRTNLLHVGFSAAHVPGENERLVATQLKYKVARHYYVSAGYKFDLSPRMALRPSLFVKSDAAVTIFDVQCDLLYDNFIWGGLTYRLQDAVSPVMGIVMDVSKTSVLKIGYSYDMGISELKYHHNNTHEIVINYCIRWEKKDESHENPRNMMYKPSSFIK